MKIYSTISTIVILIFSHLYSAAQCSRMTDSLALVSIYNNTLGSGWSNKTNWLVPGRSISTWYGVRLNAAGCVESLIMATNKMNGALPDSVGLLQGLKILSLPNNNLGGNLPVSIGNLTALEEINLSNNSLNGPIHSQFGNLTQLKKLQLSLNNFSGNLPSSLGNLKQLVILHLHQNSLNGFISPSLGSLPNLEELLLSQNAIGGPIPSSIGNLTKLKTLILSQNRLSGSIPPSIGNISGLLYFYADENQLTGTIPAEIGKLTELRELWLNKNKITGAIPAEASNLTQIQKLLLNDNNLNGQIPEFTGNLVNLISLHLSNNMLSGPLPSSFGNLVNLLSFLAGNNKLSGSIPSSFGGLKSLANLDLSKNALTGEIPPSFGQLINLKRMYLNDNMLEGCFPSSMQKFCSFTESDNISINGYNFRGNVNLIFGGDFKRWCSGEGRAKATIVSNAPLCEGSDLMLKGSGGVVFNWAGPENYSSSLQNPVITGTTASQFGKYTLIVINENKCTDTTQINVQSIGAVSASGTSPVCEGVTIELNASGGISYKWTGPNGFASILQNPVLPDATSIMEGEYTVEIKTNDCTITRKIRIDFVKTATIITNSPVCEGDTLHLEVSSGLSFVWDGPQGFKSDQQSPDIFSIKAGQDGVYKVQVKNGDNCVFTLNADVSITPRLKPATEIQDYICSYDLPIDLPSMVDSFRGVWTGPGVVQNGAQQVFDPAGLKGIQAITYTPQENGSCVSEAIENVFVNSVVIDAMEKSPSLDENDSSGSMSILLKANTGIGQNILYSGPKNGQVSSINTEEIIVDKLPSGLYNLIVTDMEGCTDTASVTIRYLKPFYFLPNIVSAGANTENNSFFVKGSNVSSYQLSVYDRWGNPVFIGKNLMVNNKDQGWYPSDASAGVYVYVLSLETFSGSKVVYGSVTVIK